LAAVHTSEGVGFGTGLKEEFGDLGGVPRRLLAVAFHSVGGQIVLKSGAVSWRVVRGDDC
jgi:hypothetical protein